MSAQTTIINTTLLERLGDQARSNPRLRMNHNFHDEPDAPAQRLLNALEPGTVIPVHRHPHTSETYVLLKGKVRVKIFNPDGTPAESSLLAVNSDQLGVHIPAGTWHGLEVLESAVIFEVKDGPYTPISPENILSDTQ